MRSSTKTIIVLALFIFSSARMFPMTSAQGDWLTGWDYRRAFTITGATGCGTDYPVLFNVTYRTGMQIDFADVRFTDMESIVLDYWLESKTNSTRALFWVEIADSLEVNATGYMYYGNAGASSLSDGYATFPFFDDFNDGSFNLSQWFFISTGGSYSESGGELHIIGGDGAYEEIHAIQEFNESYAYVMRTKIDEQDRFWIGVKDKGPSGTPEGADYDEASWGYYSSYGNKHYRLVHDASQTRPNRISDLSSYSRLEIRRDGTDVHLFENHSLKVSESDDYPSDDLGFFWVVFGDTTDSYTDWCFVRKYVAGVSSVIGEWTMMNTARFIFPVGWDPAAQFGYDAFFIFLGLIMIPASTLYFVRGGKDDMSRDKLFYFLIAFVIGWSLVIGGIMP